MTHPGETTAPIQSADLSVIIERLQNATGPDRELDAEIAFATGHFDYKMSYGFENCRIERGEKRNDEVVHVHVVCKGTLIYTEPYPRLTASIDAAIALAERVLPGWRIATEHGDNYSIAQFKRGWGWRAEVLGVATTERPDDCIALCLVTATIRALQSKGEA